MQARFRKAKGEERVPSGTEILTGTQSPTLQHGAGVGGILGLRTAGLSLPLATH